MRLELDINGELHQVEGRSDESLLTVLRRELGLASVRETCGIGVCGACTVLVDGRRVLGCLTLAAQVAGRDVVTIEGVGTPESLHDLQRAFITADGFQCGYCTSGQICSALGMLAELEDGIPSAVTEHVSGRATRTEAEVRERMSGNLCRCGAYNGIVEAIEDFAVARAGERA